MATKIATATYLPQWPIHLNLRLLRASAFVETRSMKRYPFLGTLHHIDSDCMHTIDLLRGKLRTCELNARVPDDAMTIKLSRTTIWTVVILLATVFVLVGFSKLVGPSALRWGERLSRWGYPSGSQYMIGALEILAGVGLLITKLRQSAAATLVAIMIGAVCTHLLNAEYQRLIPPLVLAAFALVLCLIGQRQNRRHSV
jgi:putative oxidoreductase